jgi:hypothetical protein
MGCGREGTQQRTEHSWKIATKKKTTAPKPYFAPIIRSKATAPIKVIAPYLPTTKDKEISPKTLRPQGYSWDKHKKKQTNTKKKEKESERGVGTFTTQLFGLFWPSLKFGEAREFSVLHARK